ncbi:hypothetical protein F503_08246 [Ophiostoma piceae UAMH 11346]|uniref:Uncharacterized protein n=1 Tax=Ophiostoma piceae (strain UAMH 11346) TaxID=1262450 RepID=S3CXY3_OPHP1|nr:hypothetical protein F503_08246 [Ophiostoma piceae UAMH 11346]
MMDALHINTKPHALLSGDLSLDVATPLQLAKSSGDPATRQRAVSEAGITSAYSQSHRHSRGLTPSSSFHPSPSSALFPFASSSPASAAPRPHQNHSTSQISSSSRPSALRQLSVAPALPPSFSPSIAVSGKDSRPGTAASGTGTPSPSPLFFGRGHKTTLETSLVGASGTYITTVDDFTVAHHTSALRELNSSFPSPVFRHRHTKSTGAQSTTYSQPVIVRTYTGPSNSPSTSAHHRRPSSSHRTGSRIAGSHRVPLVPNSRAAVSSTTPPSLAANSSENATRPGAWGLTNSLFGMARSKVKKGGFLPWSWNSNSDNASTPDEAKLPPLEAFTFKGFMANLQTSTDIRADLDRIAEICARSRYSLSNQYEAHMAPHGSGASFAASAGQSRSKGRKKGASSPGGPTLQAVPSDDDESTYRGNRRRRGGIGSGKRRSAAYGTLETIMSSSRSSEEDKTKKKPAAEIADEVRGRPARKAMQADPDATTGDTGSSGVERMSGSGSSSALPKGHRGKRAGFPTEEESGPATGKQDKGKAVRRPKSTTFAHAVIHSSRNKAQRHGGKKEGNTNPCVSGPADSVAVPALLGEPALPYTTDGSADVYSASGSAATQTVARGGPLKREAASSSRKGASLARLPTRARRPELPVHVVNDRVDDVSQLLALSPEDAAEAGFLSGLTHWIPWVAGSDAPSHSASGLHSQPQGGEADTVPAPGPSHAEGSLRELLKNVETNSTQDKGKVVDSDD